MAGPLTDDIVHGPPPPPPDRYGWGGDGGSDGPGASRRASFVGLIILLIASTMVFLAFTGAFLMRREISNDWVSMSKPRILWWNTGILIASSVSLEIARRALRSGSRLLFNRWWTCGTMLGLLFLFGQALAWRQLKEAGLYIASTPSVSFFYILTASHALHLLGGVTALVYVDVQALRFSLGPAKRTAIDVSAVFWHFLDILWLYLMALFYLWG
jgi:cytochrome c oxidase subunit III